MKIQAFLVKSTIEEEERFRKILEENPLFRKACEKSGVNPFEVNLLLDTGGAGDELSFESQEQLQEKIKELLRLFEACLMTAIEFHLSRKTAEPLDIVRRGLQITRLELLSTKTPDPLEPIREEILVKGLKISMRQTEEKLPK